MSDKDKQLIVLMWVFLFSATALNGVVWIIQGNRIVRAIEDSKKLTLTVNISKDQPATQPAGERK